MTLDLSTRGFVTTLGALAGAAAAVAGFTGYAPAALGPAGAVVACLALGAALREIVVTGSRLRAARERLEAPGTDAAELPEPLESLTATAVATITAARRDAELRTADARRARLAARTQQNEHAALRALLDNLSDGILLFDPSHTPTIANRAARRFLAHAADDELSPDLATLIARPALRPPIERALQLTDREALRTRDIDCSDADERLILRVTFQEMRDEAASDSTPPQLAVLLRDVTREVELTRMKSDFASSVSHELKTPLCSMRAFLEMLIDGDIDGEEAQREHLSMVLDQTDRLTRLVQNLLNLSRLEAGITKLQREPVQLPTLLAHLKEVTTPLATARSQSIAFEISSFVPPVTGDPAMLEQAILNLISNAIKYTPEGGSVRIVAGITGKDVEIKVIDTGVGIPAKALDLVFEKFTRIENQAGLKATGTGLGLPLAKFVAEAHGGTITVTSEVGKGSEFRMVLPLRRATDSNEAVLVGLEGMR
jgi:signal transduction histidine kinase